MPDGRALRKLCREHGPWRTVPLRLTEAAASRPRVRRRRCGVRRRRRAARRRTADGRGRDGDTRPRAPRRRAAGELHRCHHGHGQPAPLVLPDPARRTTDPPAPGHNGACSTAPQSSTTPSTTPSARTTRLRRRRCWPRSRVSWVRADATLLDVACGTGRHLEYFVREASCVGLDIEPGLLAVAGRRCPGVELVPGDMTDFELGRTFDAVTCLFSSIGYVRTVEGLRRRRGLHGPPRRTGRCRGRRALADTRRLDERSRAGGPGRRAPISRRSG